MLTIYKASAGSGKTFALAYEYIKMLLGVKQPDGAYSLFHNGGKVGACRHRHILAITFTNAATEEMKSRIVRQLSLLCEPDADSRTPYAAMLRRDLRCSSDALRQVAQAALHDLLFDYDAFNVSTIDAFFQSVLRTFSRELDRQGDYELAIDNNDVIAKAIAAMLDELNYNPPADADRLYRWIEQYSLEKLVSGEQHNFFNRSARMLADLSREMSRACGETYAIHAAEMRAYFENPGLFSNFAAFLKEKEEDSILPARGLAGDILHRLEAAGENLSLLKGPVAARLANALDTPRKLDLAKECGVKFLQLPEENTPDTYVTKARLKDSSVRAVIEELMPLFGQFCAAYPKGLALREICRKLQQSLGYQIFISMAQRSLEAYLRENNTVMLSGTGELLQQIISNEEMPFIYERLGMRLEHLLIDEFQDTSRLQWANLKPLMANSLAQDNDNLIIGDEKQSIYRFRNSDSELLGSRVQKVDFPTQHVLRGMAPADNTNHRSAGDIVRFNNTLFYFLARDYGASHYGNVVQTPAANLAAQPAYVRLVFGNRRPVEEIFEQTCLDIIRQRDAGYAWRDILVLVRRNIEGTAFVEYVTRNHPEIRLISSEALLLRNSPAVRAVISMLKLVSRSYEGRKVTRDADSAPAFATKADIVLMIMRYNHFLSQGETPAAAMELALADDSYAGEKLVGEVRAIKAENPANLVALVEAVVAHKLSPEQRHEEYAYIAALQDIAIKHSESAEPSLAQFLADYDRNENRWAIKAPAHLDAVQVMTIHTSKGLERPCVHIPCGDWAAKADVKLWVSLGDNPFFEGTTPPPLLHIEVGARSPLRDSAYSPVAGDIAAASDAERIDTLNMTYVAYTRASRELLVTFNSDTGIAADVLRAIEGASTPPCDDTMALHPHYDVAAGTLTIGEPTVPAAPGDAGNDVEDAGAYEVVYRGDTRAIVAVDDLLANPYDIGGEVAPEIVDDTPDNAAAGQLSSAGRRGLDLHVVLAGARTLDAIPASLRRYAARTGLDEATCADYEAELRSAVEAAAADVRQWFDPACRVFPERAIYDADSGETFRPDRIVLTPDGRCVVVDYKFTSAPRPSHTSQVRGYARLLRRLGYSDVEAAIWYPVLRKVLWVERGENGI